ncbi:NUDIX hydrolase [Pseudomonas aeruginosa]|nr:NUDIX hydrolase [Pseudomonas aeruginosa]
MAAPISAEEVAHRAASDAELIAWVDEQDRPLGSLPRAELRERGLIGRGTFILLFNSAGELCVQRRTLSKAVYPGYWDLAAGGMVQAGEPYADSAARARGRFFFDEPGNRLWCAVFSAVSDAPLRLQAEEISEARFIRPELALEEARSLPYCPDSLQALRLYLDA